MVEVLPALAVGSILLFIVVLVAEWSAAITVVLIAAFVIRAGLAYVHQFMRPLWASSDEYVFEQTAWLWANDGVQGLLANFDPTQSYVYSWVASVVYLVFGRQPYMVQLLGAFFGCLTAVFCYKITQSLYGRKKISFYSAVVVSFLPSLILVSVPLLRDSIVIALIAGFFYFYVVWLRTGKVFGLAWAVFFSIAAGIFHAALYFLAVAAAMSAVAAALLNRRLPLTSRISLTVVLLFSFGVGAHAYNSFLSSTKVKAAISLLDGGEYAEKIVSQNESALIADYPKPAGSDIAALLMHAPERTAFFLLTPTPFMYGKLTHLIRIADSVLVVFLLLGAFFCFLRPQEVKVIVGVSFVILFLAVMFSFGSYDVETGARHRLKILPVMVAVFFPQLVSLVRFLAGSLLRNDSRVGSGSS